MYSQQARPALVLCDHHNTISNCRYPCELSQVLSSVKLGHRVRALSFVAYVQSAFYEKSQCTIGSAQAQTCSQIVPDLD